MISSLSIHFSKKCQRYKEAGGLACCSCLVLVLNTSEWCQRQRESSPMYNRQGQSEDAQITRRGTAVENYQSLHAR